MDRASGHQPPRSSLTKHTILFLAANPLGTSRLALDEECAAIERELRMTAHRDDFEFRSKWAVTVDEMMRHLVELKPSIIHFSGHGASTTAGRSSATTRDVDLACDTVAINGIYLQGDQGGSQLVSARALTMMIKSAAASARIVVLNACYSEPQADALCIVVDSVVGMNGAIEDAAARSFAVGFYRALGNRSSVGNAVDQAVATLAAKQMPDEVLPRCVTRDGIDKYQVILEPLPESNRDTYPEQESRLKAQFRLAIVVGSGWVPYATAKAALSQLATRKTPKKRKTMALELASALDCEDELRSMMITMGLNIGLIDLVMRTLEKDVHDAYEKVTTAMHVQLHPLVALAFRSGFLLHAELYSQESQAEFMQTLGKELQLSEDFSIALWKERDSSNRMSMLLGALDRLAEHHARSSND